VKNTEDGRTNQQSQRGMRDEGKRDKNLINYMGGAS
jgi:hypothetical protein